MMVEVTGRYFCTYFYSNIHQPHDTFVCFVLLALDFSLKVFSIEQSGIFVLPIRGIDAQGV